MSRITIFSVVSVAAMILMVSSSCQIEYKKPPIFTEKEQITKIETGADEYINKAKSASDHFHDLFNEGRYNEMFQLVDDKSELIQDPIYFDRAMHRISSDLGKFESASFTRGNAFQKKSTYEVRLEYIAKYDKENGKAPRYELFYWEIYPDGTLKLLNYRNGIDNEPGYAY